MRRRIFACTSGTLAAFAMVAAPAAVAQDQCVPAMNVEAIIDDSSSMLDFDPQFARVSAMDKFVHMVGPTVRGGNEDKTLGVTEFSGETRQLVPPQQIGPNADAITSVLEQNILGDGTTGVSTGTDYDAAFQGAAANNPNAQARIFLTDGEHNVQDNGPYDNAHQGGPPIYVLGFGGAATPDGQARLQQIANETGGKFFPASDNTTLQRDIGEITSILSCTPLPETSTDTFAGVGDKVRKKVPISPDAQAVNVSVSWLEESDAFKIRKIVIKRNGKTVAGTTNQFKPSKRLDVTKEAGETYVNLSIENLRKGKLQFEVKATAIGSFTQPEVTTQESLIK